MLSDVLNKRKTEIDNINGAIVRLGQQYGVDTHVNNLLTKMVLLKEKLYNNS
jgi:2-dehydropantoate 2-reductase